MDMSCIDECVCLGQWECWWVVNEDGYYLFYVYGCLFFVFLQQGCLVVFEDVGWKDIVLVSDSVEFFVCFDYEVIEKYLYMYYCYIFEYEDMGMMGQFIVMKL